MRKKATLKPPPAKAVKARKAPVGKASKRAAVKPKAKPARKSAVTKAATKPAAPPPMTKRAPVKPPEEDDWVRPIGNDGSVACGVFLLLAVRHVSGDVHPTCDLAMCALHMLWASVDDASPWEVAKQSFCRLATPGALRLTNVNGNAIVSSVGAATFRELSSICHGPRANVIVRVDTEALTGVTEIGDYFLWRCGSLVSVILRGLAGVTTVGDSFLRGCIGLKAIDLAPLSRVTTVGDWFLDGCSSLTAIDVAPLSRLTALPCGFLHGCTSLQSLDCRPLRSVTTIGPELLCSCAALQQLDVSSFSTVTKIGQLFLCSCPALRHLDLSSMANVSKLIAPGLLAGHGLESLIRPATGALATAAIKGF